MPPLQTRRSPLWRRSAKPAPESQPRKPAAHWRRKSGMQITRLRPRKARRIILIPPRCRSVCAAVETSLDKMPQRRVAAGKFASCWFGLQGHVRAGPCGAEQVGASLGSQSMIPAGSAPTGVMAAVQGWAAAFHGALISMVLMRRLYATWLGRLLLAAWEVDGDPTRPGAFLWAVVHMEMCTEAALAWVRVWVARLQR